MQATQAWTQTDLLLLYFQNLWQWVFKKEVLQTLQS